MLTGGREFHLHFLQLGKALKGSSGLQGGDVIVVEAAAEYKMKLSLTITQVAFEQLWSAKSRHAFPAAFP